MTEEKSNRGEISAFNEGALQMLRIDKEQKKINFCRMSLLTQDFETGRYYYEIMFSCLNSLFAECSSKLSTTELKEGVAIRKKISVFLRDNLIFRHLHDPQHRYKQKYIPDFKNFRILEDLLFDYELKIRHFLETHNLTAPKGESPDRAAYK